MSATVAPQKQDLAALARSLLKQQKKLKPGRKYEELQPFVDVLDDDGWDARNITQNIIAKVPGWQKAKDTALYAWVARYTRNRRR